MRPSTAVALALALSALLVTAPIGAVAFDPAASVEAQDPPDPADPRQVIVIDLDADGNATWTIEHRYRLESDEEIDQFEAYADAVTAGERSIDYDPREFRRFASQAAVETGREMEIVDASWDEPTVESANESADGGDATAESDARVGTISYSFTWTNFTRTTDRNVYLGDVFTVDGTNWFPSLTEHQRLEIVAPEDHGVEDASRAPSGGTLVWDGPHDFEEGEIRATYLGGGNGGNGSGGDGTDGGDGGDGGTDSGLASTIATGLGLLGLLAIVAAGGYVFARRGSLARADESADDSAADADEDVPELDGETPVASGGDPPAIDEDVAESGTELRHDETEFDDDVDVELLSDEERVHRLLRENGGRMKQASIVTETGWSNAKVSQLLSKMDDDDEIEKLRIGRENLITLPEVDPTEIE